MSLAERLSWKFHICSRSCASRPNIHFSGNLSAVDIISRHTSRLKARFIHWIFPNFQICVCCEKYLKDNKYYSLHLAQKYAPIFVREHYVFFGAHSFPEATLSENCPLLGTMSIRGQISEHIFAQNGTCCLCIRNRSNNRDQTAGNSLFSSEIIPTENIFAPNRGYGSYKTGPLSWLLVKQ